MINASTSRTTESSDFLAEIVAASNDAIVSVRLDGTITSWNRAAERIFQYTAREIIGQPLSRITPQDRWQEAREALQRAGNAGRTERFETIRQRKDGTLVEVSLSISPARNEAGAVTGAFAIVQDLTERRLLEQARREQAQREANERVETVFRQMTEGLILSDLDGRVLHWNPAAKALHGFTDESEWQRSLGEFAADFELLTLDGKVLPFEEWPLRRIASGDHFRGLELRIRRRDKDWERVFSYSGDRVREPSGAQLAFLTINDVTRRSRAEEQLRESVRHIRDLETALNEHAIVAITDAEGKIAHVNDQFCEISKYTREELIGRDHPTTSSRRHSPDFMQALKRILLAGKAWKGEFQDWAKDGTPYWLNATIVPFLDASGKPRQYVAVGANITEQKRAQSIIEEQANLLDEAQEAIVVRGLDGRIRFWSKGAERIFEWTRDEVVGRDAIDLLCKDPDHCRAALRSVIEHGGWAGELELAAKSGRAVIAEMRCSLLRDDEGQPKAVLSVSLDITAKKKLDAQALRAQRMESIGTLAGGVAHDLNNMLAPILMSLELLREKLPDASDQQLLSTLEEGTTRGADLVRQILTFAQGFESAHILVNPKHIIRQVSRILRDTLMHRINVETEVSADVCPVLGDPTQLHQVLLNLCVNARDAMPGGGTLTIRAENHVLTEAAASLHLGAAPGPYVLLTVTDTGTGIPKEIQDKIFDPFFTTKEVGKGTGLGLSTTAGIVKSHHGFIDLYSEMGQGTTFRIYLPAEASAGACSGALDEAEEMPRGEEQLVLIVDDEVSMRAIGGQILEGFGYRVIAAADGREAARLFLENRAEVAAVITDMMMPNLDGPAAIRAIRHLNPAIPIIAVTGLATDAQRDTAARAGADYFLPKPFAAGNLLRLLHEALAGKGPAPPA